MSIHDICIKLLLILIIFVIITIGGRMNTLLIVIFIIIVILILLMLGYICLFNKFNESIVRIDEAEDRIDTNLRDKYDLLDKVVTLSKNIIPLDEELGQTILKLRSRKLSNFDFDRILVKIFNDYNAIYEMESKLKENEKVFKIVKQIELIDEELITLRSYYNANISNYNMMVKKFPTNLIAKIKKYKERLFYSLKDMSDEDYEDFKL